MARSRVLYASCYDYPQYYDIAFQAYTQREADFIEAACRKYCPFDARRFLEPACGTGRLITALAARGYQVTGFDISRPALSYLRRRLAQRRLHAETFGAELSDFRVSRRSRWSLLYSRIGQTRIGVAVRRVSSRSSDSRISAHLSFCCVAGGGGWSGLGCGGARSERGTPRDLTR